jgi:hypothetical protein
MNLKGCRYKMKNEKFQYNLAKILSLFPNAHELNKSQAQQAIKMSASTWDRREKSNDKYALPRGRIISYPCSNRPYNGYSYDVYELAMFMTDKDYYWAMIESKSGAAHA